MVDQLREALYESIKEQILKEVYEDVLRDLASEAKNGRLQISLKDIKNPPKQKPRSTNTGTEDIELENLTLEELDSMYISEPIPKERKLPKKEVTSGPEPLRRKLPEKVEIIDSLEYSDILE